MVKSPVGDAKGHSLHKLQTMIIGILAAANKGSPNRNCGANRRRKRVKRDRSAPQGGALGGQDCLVACAVLYRQI